MNHHNSIDSGLHEIQSLNQQSNRLQNVDLNVFLDYLSPIGDSAIDLRFNPYSAHSEAQEAQVRITLPHRALVGRNRAIRDTGCLDLAWFWLLFLPALLFVVFVACHWLLMIALVANGLCWWPFCVLAFSDSVHMLAALVFIHMKTANSDSVTASPPIYAGLLIVVHCVGFIIYILCITLEAPAHCFSTSFKEKLTGQTLNSSYPHTNTNLSILFPLYRELAAFVSYKFEQSTLWYSPLQTTRKWVTPKHIFIASDESVELSIFVFVLVDLLVRTSAFCVLVLETCAALRLHLRSRPLYSPVHARFADNARCYCIYCFTRFCLAPVWWAFSVCAWALRVKMYKAIDIVHE